MHFYEWNQLKFIAKNQNYKVYNLGDNQSLKRELQQKYNGNIQINHNINLITKHKL